MVSESKGPNKKAWVLVITLCCMACKLASDCRGLLLFYRSVSLDAFNILGDGISFRIYSNLLETDFFRLAGTTYPEFDQSRSYLDCYTNFANRICALVILYEVRKK